MTYYGFCGFRCVIQRWRWIIIIITTQVISRGESESGYDFKTTDVGGHREKDS